MEGVEFSTQIDVDNDESLDNIKIEDLLQNKEFLGEIIQSSLISEQEVKIIFYFKNLNYKSNFFLSLQQKAFPELTYHGEQITQFVQNTTTTTTIFQPRDLAELVQSLDIAEESSANSFVFIDYGTSQQLPAPVVSISGGDSGYESPLYTYSSPSPSEYQYSQPLVIPSPPVQENAYEFQQRPRGRPACDWFDVDFINQLRASANGDPDKLKKINNNIASGQYRFNKKARKNATPCDSELMKLKNLNTKLRNQKRKNDEWIKKVQTLIASKALNVYSF